MPPGYTQWNRRPRLAEAIAKVNNLVQLPAPLSTAPVTGPPLAPVILEYLQAQKEYEEAAAEAQRLFEEGKPSENAMQKTSNALHKITQLRKIKVVKNYRNAMSIERGSKFVPPKETYILSKSPAVKNTHSALFGKTLRKLRRKSRKGSRGKTRRRRNALRV